MTCAQTYSWVFYSVGLASLKTPATAREVEQAANGINHAFPTQREMLESITWCSTHGLIQREGGKFSLTQTGTILFQEARSGARTTSGVWNLLTKRFTQMEVDDQVELNPRTMRPAHFTKMGKANRNNPDTEVEDEPAV